MPLLKKPFLGRLSVATALAVAASTVVLSPASGREPTPTERATAAVGWPPAAPTQLVIDTAGAVIDREDYVAGTVTLDGVTRVTEVRGRGNSTWGWAKKPYKLKLEDDAALVGSREYDEWVLLAGYADRSSLRTAAAFAVAAQTRLGWTPALPLRRGRAERRVAGPLHADRAGRAGQGSRRPPRRRLPAGDQPALPPRRRARLPHPPRDARGLQGPRRDHEAAAPRGPARGVALREGALRARTSPTRRPATRRTSTSASSSTGTSSRSSSPTRTPTSSRASTSAGCPGSASSSAPSGTSTSAPAPGGGLLPARQLGDPRRAPLGGPDAGGPGVLRSRQEPVGPAQAGRAPGGLRDPGRSGDAGPCRRGRLGASGTPPATWSGPTTGATARPRSSSSSTGSPDGSSG